MTNYTKENFLFKKIEIEDYELMIQEIRSKVLEEINDKSLTGFDYLNIRDFLNACPRFKKYINSKKLILRVIVVISVPPFMTRCIHVDSVQFNHNSYALNMGIFNYEYTRTQLFKPLINATPISKDAGENKTYLEYNDEDCILLDEFNLKDPILFDTSIPHRVCNNTREKRISVSFRFLNDPFYSL